MAIQRDHAIAQRAAITLDARQEKLVSQRGGWSRGVAAEFDVKKSGIEERHERLGLGGLLEFLIGKMKDQRVTGAIHATFQETAIAEATTAEG